MSFQTVVLAILVLGFGAAQYLLCFRALRDLRRRTRVRGNNRVVWALAILCLPILGSLLYTSIGPTSFKHRPLATQASRELPAAPSNITPIGAARTAQNAPPPAVWPPAPSVSQRTASTSRGGKRTAS